MIASAGSVYLTAFSSRASSAILRASPSACSVPAVISPFDLPKIGAAARRYFLTGERFDAATALRIGLVHDVAADLDTAVDAVVDELLSGGPEAARAAKRLVRERPGGRATAEIAAVLRAGDEGQEGLRAFLEHRAPSWRGG